MENKKPLLSICIPTYNRADALEETLSHIVDNPYFTDEIEVVISDNASTDNTEEIGRQFADKYDNINYYRNIENVRDQNFWIVLNRATGEYRKLWHDRLYPTDDAFPYMLNTIKENYGSTKNIFFTNRTIGTELKGLDGPFICDDLNKYVDIMSFAVTYILNFGIWARFLDDIKNPLEYNWTMLNQDDWSYQIVSTHGCVLYNKKIDIEAKSFSNTVRQGYNWFEIHLENYYHIMSKYLESGLITKETYSKEVRHYLNHFIPYLAFSIFKNVKPQTWGYGTANSFVRFFKQFKSEPYFYYTLCKIPYIYAKMLASQKLPYSLKHKIKKLIRSSK